MLNHTIVKAYLEGIQELSNYPLFGGVWLLSVAAALFLTILKCLGIEQEVLTWWGVLVFLIGIPLALREYLRLKANIIEYLKNKLK